MEVPSDVLEEVIGHKIHITDIDIAREIASRKWPEECYSKGKLIIGGAGRAATEDNFLIVTRPDVQPSSQAYE